MGITELKFPWNSSPNDPRRAESPGSRSNPSGSNYRNDGGRHLSGRPSDCIVPEMCRRTDLPLRTSPTQRSRLVPARTAAHAQGGAREPLPSRQV